MAIVITILSNSFIFQSRFLAPIDEIEESEEIYSFNSSNSYICQDSNEDYYIHTTEGFDVQISEEDAEKLVENGFNLIYKGE